MAALPIYLDATARVKSPPAITVMWRKDWPNDWQPADAEVISLERGCGPTVDRCLLRQRYGYVSRAGSQGFDIVYPYQTSIINSFVKVEFIPDLLSVVTAADRLGLEGLQIGAVVYESFSATVYRFLGPEGSEAAEGSWDEHDIPRNERWYGVITGIRRDAMGGDVLGESGDLIIEALGMEVLMTRKQIDTSIVELETGTSTHIIERGLPFNAHRGDRDRGTYETANRASALVGGSPCFAKRLISAENWTATQIVKYLLANHQPADETGPWFELDPDQTLLNGFIPVDVETDGRTLYSVISNVIDRRRGVLWWIEPVGAEGELIFRIKVQSSEITNVTLPSGVVLPANTQIRSLAIDSVGHMISYREQYDALRKFSQVIVEGGRQGAVFTLSMADQTLERDWTVAEENRYKTAASEAEGYLVLDRVHQMTLNDAVRSRDRLRHVYTRFRIPLDWNGRAGDGKGGDKFHVFPVIPPTGDPPQSTTGHEFWRDGLRFQNVIPLKAGWDYVGTGSYVPENLNPVGTIGEFRRPLAAISIKNHEEQDEWFYADVAGIDTATDELRKKCVGRVSCSLRMHEEQPGLSLIPNAPSHALAGDLKFDGSDPLIQISHIGSPVTDFETAVFTVYALADNRIRVSYPEQAETVSNQASVHVIRLGDRARVDYVVPGTVVDVTGGELQRTVASLLARDDRRSMLDLARQAWLWYGVTRVAIELGIAHVSNQMRLGDLINQVRYGYRYITTTAGAVIFFGGKPWMRSGSTDRVVNSTITRIMWNFERGSTAFTTDYTEIDFEGEYR